MLKNIIWIGANTETLMQRLWADAEHFMTSSPALLYHSQLCIWLECTHNRWGWWGGRWFSEWAVSDPWLCLSSVGSFHLLLFVHECECMTDRNAHGHWYCHSLVSTLHKFFRIVLSIFLFKGSYHIMSIWGCSFGKRFFGFAFVFFQFVTRWQYYADVNHCPCWLFTFLM